MREDTECVLVLLKCVCVCVGARVCVFGNYYKTTLLSR